jgi:methylmalonyl-CoA/ethylmalonyl-CoA epimerase
MIKQIDHLAIAVSDLPAALRFFLDGLGGRQVWSAPMPGAGFRWTTVELGASCLIELVNPEGARDEVRSGFLQRFLDRHGPGVHHITLQVESVERLRDTLDQRGIPHFGFGEPLPGWKELFIHPRDAFGVLLQFAEFDPFAWLESGAPVPVPYQRFAPPGAVDQQIQVTRMEHQGEPRVELRQADARLCLRPEQLPGLIRALQECLPAAAGAVPKTEG